MEMTFEFYRVRERDGAHARLRRATREAGGLFGGYRDCQGACADAGNAAAARIGPHNRMMMARSCSADRSNKNHYHEGPYKRVGCWQRRSGILESEGKLQPASGWIMCIWSTHRMGSALCPSSDDLRDIAGLQKGGSGSSMIAIMRHGVDGASDGLRWSGA
jgi:hypothetical protein